VEEVSEGCNLVINERLVGLAEADLVDCVDVILGSESANIRNPKLFSPSKTVQKNPTAQTKSTSSFSRVC
jgi:hypothetical protein